ncbi:hypothetical protein [Fusibacter ferrireducens]|uniref:Uncharacterized protein n=1 Tax=Fusibacter ferrireducens TaxID=2785058 RepID=A0ABR9ZPX6_9FIRM|nr:hypothetical protein [Fusibacter ferrireducens]MBF4692469.1 hypothetical protein [Fusibacter ferrireducens]
MGKRVQKGKIKIQAINTFTDREKPRAVFWNTKVPLHYDNIWIVGYTSPKKVPILFEKKLKNVPDMIIFNDEFRNFSHGKPQQFYYE